MDEIRQIEALNNVTRALLDQQKKNCKMLFVALVISLCVNLIIVFSFLWYESQWENVVTDEYQITQTADGDSDINNVSGNQYNDNATHNEGGLEDAS